jgi:hypothetical protein
LTNSALKEQTGRILNIFPKMPLAMLEELKQAFIDNAFSDEQMKKSIDNVRDTYSGWDKIPNIANFIKFDETVKLKTYEDIINETADFSPEARRSFFENHKTIKQNGKTFWVEK